MPGSLSLIFDENGYLPLKKGWWKDPATEAWYYIKPSLSCETGWRQLGKNWYFFDRCTGRMADLYLLAATVYTEAGGEDYMGQVAVANVILNRLRSGKFGKTLSSVH